MTEQRRIMENEVVTRISTLKILARTLDDSNVFDEESKNRMVEVVNERIAELKIDYKRPMSEYVDYKQAKMLKAAGFNWECDRYYCAFDEENDIRFWSCHPAANHNRYNTPKKVIASAPTLYLTQKWLREVAGIAINVDAHDGDFYMWEEVYLSNAPKSNGLVIFRDLIQYTSYEEALSKGVSAVLDYLLGLNFKV